MIYDFDLLDSYFKSEYSKDMFDNILFFLKSHEIREGKFEGNEILLNKLNRSTVIAYKEYELSNGTFEYSLNANVFDIEILLRSIEETIITRNLIY